MFLHVGPRTGHVWRLGITKILEKCPFGIFTATRKSCLPLCRSAIHSCPAESPVCPSFLLRCWHDRARSILKGHAKAKGHTFASFIALEVSLGRSLERPKSL